MKEFSQKIVLTGFMGVGKTTVAHHLGSLLKTNAKDLDDEIELTENKDVAAVIAENGEDYFRDLEHQILQKLLEEGTVVIALGGGTFTFERNRELIKNHQCMSIWLESTFDHSWHNIRRSKVVRPLAADKNKAERLYNDRLQSYCLADWHFVIHAGYTSFDVAERIFNDIYGS
ncbi:MAG: shikimate kinase [Pyrinomonadaceae bacterium]